MACCPYACAWHLITATVFQQVLELELLTITDLFHYYKT